MSSKIEKKLSQNKNKQFFLLFLKITNIALLVAILILSFSYVKLSQQKLAVIGVNANNEPLQEGVITYKGSNMGNIVNKEQFLKTVINLLFNYNKDTYEMNLNQALQYMNREVAENYMKEIEIKGFKERVKDLELRSFATVKRINWNEEREYKDGRLVTADVIIVEGKNLDENTIYKKIDIAYRTTEYSRNNIWGLEIIKMDERNVEKL